MTINKQILKVNLPKKIKKNLNKTTKPSFTQPISGPTLSTTTPLRPEPSHPPPLPVRTLRHLQSGLPAFPPRATNPLQKPTTHIFRPPTPLSLKPPTFLSLKPPTNQYNVQSYNHGIDFFLKLSLLFFWLGLNLIDMHGFLLSIVFLILEI